MPCLKSQIISSWFLEHVNEFTLLIWAPLSSYVMPVETLWDVLELESHLMDKQLRNLQQLCDAFVSIWIKISEKCLLN